MQEENAKLLESSKKIDEDNTTLLAKLLISEQIVNEKSRQEKENIKEAEERM